MINLFLFPRKRGYGKIAHGVDSVTLKTRFRPFSYPPKIRERTMIPKLSPVFLFRKRDYRNFSSRRYGFFSQNIHRYLGKIEILSQSHRGYDSHFLIDLFRHFSRQILCSLLVYLHIRSEIDKYLIYGIDINILLGDKAQVNFINTPAILHVKSHSRRCGNVRKSKKRVSR